MHRPWRSETVWSHRNFRQAEFFVSSSSSKLHYIQCNRNQIDSSVGTNSLNFSHKSSIEIRGIKPRPNSNANQIVNINFSLIIAFEQRKCEFSFSNFTYPFASHRIVDMERREFINKRRKHDVVNGQVKRLKNRRYSCVCMCVPSDNNSKVANARTWFMIYKIRSIVKPTHGFGEDTIPPRTRAKKKRIFVVFRLHHHPPPPRPYRRKFSVRCVGMILQP